MKEYENKKLYKEMFDEIPLPSNLDKKILFLSKTNKRKKVPKGLMAAALVLIIMFPVTYVFAKVTGIWKFNSYKSDIESGYEISVNIPIVPIDFFAGEISEVHDIILKQQRDYEPYMSLYPLSYTKEFDTVNDALKYIGVDSSYNVINDKADYVAVDILCNESGDIIHVTLMTDYVIDGNNTQIWYHIFSELSENPGDNIVAEIGDGQIYKDKKLSNMTDTMTFQVSTESSVDYMISSGWIGSGTEVPVICSSANENGLITTESYFSKGKVLYSINVVSEKKSSANNTLKKILAEY